MHSRRSIPSYSLHSWAKKSTHSHCESQLRDSPPLINNSQAAHITRQCRRLLSVAPTASLMLISSPQQTRRRLMPSCTCAEARDSVLPSHHPRSSVLRRSLHLRLCRYGVSKKAGVDLGRCHSHNSCMFMGDRQLMQQRKMMVTMEQPNNLNRPPMPGMVSHHSLFTCAKPVLCTSCNTYAGINPAMACFACPYPPKLHSGGGAESEADC